MQWPLPTNPLEAFRAAVSRPDDEIDLAHAALVAAQYEYPGLDPAPTLRLLDDLAERTVRGAGCSSDAMAQVQSLIQVLLGPQGLHLRGARDGIGGNYYDPCNSFPHTVIERGVGIPIALSIILISVGARAGIALGGAGMPLHFLVRVLGLRPPMMIDCYDGGRLLDERACAETLRILSQGRISFRREMLDIVPNTDVLTRYLTNLKLIYYDDERYIKAVAVLDRLIVLNPDMLELTCERGKVFYRLGQGEDARRDLETYLEMAGNPPDAVEVRELLKKIK